MIDILAMLPAFALGWIVVRLLARLGWWLEIPLGAGLGAAISSVLFFLLTWIGAANRGSLLATEGVMIAIGAALIYVLM
ncbi:MAG: hypothetical protein LAO79_25005, partial [Acidobacteriia bacterium]|nr:hypothetical protein [Terriglobia bacterium]